MLLSTRQAAEILRVKPNVVSRLVAAKKLPTMNANGHRVNHLFDPKVVVEFKKTYVPRVYGVGAALTKTAPITPAITEQLQRIEDKLDTLLGIWK